MVKFIRKEINISYYSSNSIEIKRIENCLKYYVEGGEYSPAFRNGTWDGYYRFYNKKLRTFPYGLLGLVIEQLKKYNIKYSIENDFKPLKFIGSINNTMWNHSQLAIQEFRKKPYGTIEVPTRGGKTKLTSEIIRLGNFDSVCFVVDSQLLLEQAINDISSHLKINRKQIGRIQGENFIIKPITVAMIQTMQSIKYGINRLKKRNKKEPIELNKLKQDRKERRLRSKQLENYLAQVNFLIVDEVHEYTSDERISTVKMVKNANAYLFLSATPWKSESNLDSIKILSIAGEKIFKVSEKELKEAGVLAYEHIILIEIDHYKNKNIHIEEEDAYSNYEQKIIIKNERRNNILTNIIQICKHLQLKNLVLFNKVEHGEYIQNITGDELLTGKTKLSQRIATKNSFLKRKGGALLATNIFNKGITLPEVEIMTNAGGGLEQSSLIQKKGRTLGTTSTKKKALTIDFMDVSEYFNVHSLSRIQVYEQRVGIENISVFSSSDPDFYNDLREFLNDWKNT
jgi:superfamily II DNA or RNA helicase